MASGVQSKADLEKYFKEAQSWDFDRARKAEREKKIAYGIAGAGVVFGLAMLGLYALNPLRSVEPYVIRVDRQSGGVDVMTRLSNSREITRDEAVNKYFLSQYVRSREGWMAAAADQYFNGVVSLSSPAEQEKYASYVRPENPRAPINIYQAGQVITATVRNITFINDRVAQVRFVRTVTRPGNMPDETSTWVATINFKYLDKPTTEAGRLLNPLGFQVISYRADPELTP